MVTSQAGVDAVSVVTEIKPSNCGLTLEKDLNINRNIEIFFLVSFDINTAEFRATLLVLELILFTHRTEYLHTLQQAAPRS
jgi:hypothetical protein